MANDTKYLYSGPLSGVTLKVKGEDGAVTEQHVPLNPGAEVTLPADHPYVKKLKGKGYLAESDKSDPSGKSEPLRVKRQKEATENAG